MRVGIRESVRVGIRESVSAPPPAYMSHDYNAQLTKKNRGSAHPVRENSRERERERESKRGCQAQRERGVVNHVSQRPIKSRSTIGGQRNVT